jgi:probable DNA repair protein
VSANWLTQLRAAELVLTANKRLADSLTQQYDQWQINQGRQAWPSPVILPYNTWLTRCWQQHQQQALVQDAKASLPYQLLNPTQELMLWQQVISQTPGAELLQPRTAAQQAQRAWRLLWDWQLELSACEFADTLDSRTFQHWAQDYLALTQARGWLDQARLPLALKASLATHDFKVNYQQIYLYGFTELIPSCEQLLAQLKQQGISWQQVALPGQQASCQRVICQDIASEITSAAQWAYQASQNPQISGLIGVVVPDLETHRAQIIRTFCREFGVSQWALNDVKQQPFNLSLGLPLTQYAMIQTAFACLSTTHSRYLSLELVDQLVRSAFVKASASEGFQRAALMAQLYNQQEPRFAVAEIIKLAADSNCPELAVILDYCQTFQPSGKQSVNKLLKAWGDCLEHWDWPGELPLDSREYQLHQAFLELLEEYASLAHQLPQESWQQGVSRLSWLAQGKLFQPQQRPGNRVHILGLLEATGLSFDALWLMNMDDQTLPASARPDSLLPLALQRRYQMPHASAERELIFATQLLDHWQHNSRQLWISHSAWQGDQAVAPSPLTRDFPLAANQWTITDSPYQQSWQQRQKANRVESWQDQQAPVLTTDESVTGGATLLKDQAACPFRAFAKGRLKAQPLAEPALGLLPAERGQIIHQVLAALWHQLKDSQGLASLAPSALEALLNQQLKRALTAVQRRRPQSLASELLLLEQQRLNPLIQQWLEQEKKRPDFQVIAQEQKLDLVLAGLPLTLRLDRLDRLPDGQQVVIDYKTGEASIKDWFDQRPQEPQLLLYALALTKRQPDSQPIAGLAFAQIRPNDLRFKGIVDDADKLPLLTDFSRVKALQDYDVWTSWLTDRYQVLNELAADFMAGQAEVDPSQGTLTCRYCGLQPLCRIAEQLDGDNCHKD